MAKSSCKREESTRNAYESAVAGIGLSKSFGCFLDNVQNPEHSDGCEKDMVQVKRDV